MESKTKNKKIWTIGHSTHSWEAFLEMLETYAIDVLVDVRSYPGSRKFPQFNKDNLEKLLPKQHIEYQHFPDLGGRRKPNPESTNTVWRHPSFRAYADYMETESFQKAVKKLEELALQKRVVMMCSEAVWWRCHRSMISDLLKVQNWEVLHIMSATKVMEHPFTAPAKEKNGKLIYSE